MGVREVCTRAMSGTGAAAAVHQMDDSRWNALSVPVLADGANSTGGGGSSVTVVVYDAA